MEQIAFEIPDDMPLALKIPRENIGKELLMLAAVKLYEMGKLSSGAAAELAGVPRVVFLVKLADYGVNTFEMTEEELDRETSLVRNNK